MMRPLPAISHGVLLSRDGEVHRNVGGQTRCGRRVVTGRATTVSAAQALVYRLALCHLCYRHQPGGDERP